MAGRRRQHHLGRPRWPGAPGGVEPAGDPRTRGAAAGLPAPSPRTTERTGRFHDCLDRLKERLSDPVGDRLVESLRIAREVGGSDLGTLLRTLSTFLREDSRTRAELETRQGWTVNAARLAVAAPWVVLGDAVHPTGVHPGLRDPTGTLVLLVGAALSVAAYRIMVFVGRLPEDERVLR